MSRCVHAPSANKLVRPGVHPIGSWRRDKNYFLLCAPRGQKTQSVRPFIPPPIRTLFGLVQVPLPDSSF